ncbi:MAG: Asp-tRNA(Asn)/Glu-tRNA(Gln) amidotransferase subunit GatC [Phycisphaerae bacterium]|nr:Asp-tRNA(Asn)/Glu-tRNA(Gln) amidotransferase subunit GatC [Phycisphaerae bacterium]
MPETIDEQRVRRIGTLSRIALSDAEVATFSRQLGDILAHFDKLQELDTDNVEPMAHAVELTNVLADDTPGESLSREQALSNAPAHDDDLFAVPKLIGDSQ